MNLIEKILIGLIVIPGAGRYVLGSEFADETFILFCISNISLIVLLIHYAIQTKVAPLSIVFLLLIVGVVGQFFYVQSWGGFSILQLIGFCGSILFAGLLAWKLQAEKNTSVYLYAAAIGILAQAVCFLIGDKFNSYGAVLNYFLVGIIGTIKLNDTKVELGIDKGLTFYLVTSLIGVLSMTIDILK